MKKKVKITLVALGIIILFAALLYTAGVITGHNYTVMEERDYNNSTTLTATQIDKIFGDAYFTSSFWNDEAWVVQYVALSVADCMHYTMKNDLANMRGNCEGQAMVCSAAINYAFKKCGIEGCYAKPVIVQAYLYGINMNSVLSSVVPTKYRHFVKNHCVTKVHHSNGYEEYFDTSIPFCLTPKKK